MSFSKWLLETLGLVTSLVGILHVCHQILRTQTVYVAEKIEANLL